MFIIAFIFVYSHQLEQGMGDSLFYFVVFNAGILFALTFKRKQKMSWIKRERAFNFKIFFYPNVVAFLKCICINCLMWCTQLVLICPVVAQTHFQHPCPVELQK